MQKCFSRILDFKLDCCNDINDDEIFHIMRCTLKFYAHLTQMGISKKKKKLKNVEEICRFVKVFKRVKCLN